MTDATSRQPPLECGRKFPGNQLWLTCRIEADRPFAWPSPRLLNQIERRVKEEPATPPHHRGV